MPGIVEQRAQRGEMLARQRIAMVPHWGNDSFKGGM
jgi:hypothetical protein